MCNPLLGQGGVARSAGVVRRDGTLPPRRLRRHPSSSEEGMEKQPGATMQQLNPSEISELIHSKIQNLSLSADVRTQGTVVTVTDGICRVHGLSDVMQGEMLEFPNNTIGLALNLERDSVGSVILGEYEHITEGDAVKCTGRILEVPVGPERLGRVVDALAQAIDRKGATPAMTSDL